MDKLLDLARGLGTEGERGVIRMEPIGFAVSLLPTVPQEIILVHPPGDLQFTQYTHFHINDWTVSGVI